MMDGTAGNSTMRVKICCIMKSSEAQLALNQGADALGFVSHMPSGPGVLTDAAIRDLIRQLPGETDTWLLTAETQPEAILRQLDYTGATSVQLVDDAGSSTRSILHRERPDIKVVQVIHITPGKDPVPLSHWSNHADALLLDSGNPSGRQRELGGTGRTHDWDLSAKICENASIPVFLAGGLHAGNVVEALSRVKPAGIDVCSGVRTAGELDPTKLEEFMVIVRNAPSSTHQD